MKPQIYQDFYFEIETDHGTEIVPSDVIGRTTATDVSAFLDYLEGKPLDENALIDVKHGWLARMSAPGYMDCTEWSAHTTEKEAYDYLVDMYGAPSNFTYHINLDERGEFYADVRDSDGNTVFEIRSEDDGSISLIEDGFMADKHDMEGLADHLKDMGIMESDDNLTEE
jgi:hypothetical protein